MFIYNTVVLGRNAFRAPGFEQWDLAADKNFHLAERFNLRSAPSSLIF